MYASSRIDHSIERHVPERPSARARRGREPKPGARGLRKAVAESAGSACRTSGTAMRESVPLHSLHGHDRDRAPAADRRRVGRDGRVDRGALAVRRHARRARPERRRRRDAARARRRRGGDARAAPRARARRRSSTASPRCSPSAQDEVARTISAEAGKPMKAARVEASRAVSTFTMAAVEARKLAGDVVPMDASPAGEGKLAFTLRVADRRSSARSRPFNFPLNLVAHKIAPALAAGCAVVLKPASQTPLSALLLAELELEAGLPPGWLNVVCGPASEIGDVLVAGRAREADHVHGLGPDRLEASRARGAEAREPRARERDAGHRRRGRRPRRRGRAARRERVLVRRARAASRCSGSTSSDARTTRSSSASSRASRRSQVGDPADEATDVGPLIAESERDRILALDRGGDEP